MYDDYDLKKLKARLERLPHPARVSFAAACATRLVSAYERHSSAAVTRDIAELRGSLDALWDWTAGGLASTDTCQQRIARLSELIPEDDDATSSLSGLAEDALASAIYALQSTADPGVEAASWAAGRVVDAATAIVTDEWMRSKGRCPTPKEAFTDPYVAGVLQCLERDLRELETLVPGADINQLRAMRTRASAEKIDGGLPTRDGPHESTKRCGLGNSRPFSSD